MDKEMLEKLLRMIKEIKDNMPDNTGTLEEQLSELIELQKKTA